MWADVAANIGGRAVAGEAVEWIGSWGDDPWDVTAYEIAVAWNPDEFVFEYGTGNRDAAIADATAALCRVVNGLARTMIAHPGNASPTNAGGSPFVACAPCPYGSQTY